MGTDRPAAAAIGARMSDVLSPTPPVLCLSIFGPGISLRSTTTPEFIMAAVSEVVSADVIPLQMIAIKSADH